MKRNSEARKLLRRRKQLVVATCIIAVMVVIVLGYSVWSISDKNKESQEKIDQLKQELQAEQLKAEELEELEKDIASDKYVEKIAREKFNLAYPDDIVFKPITK